MFLSPLSSLGTTPPATLTRLPWQHSGDGAARTEERPGPGPSALFAGKIRVTIYLTNRVRGWLIERADFPYAQLYKYDPWPECREGERDMEFRLTYKGKLPAVSRGTSRAKDKHDIRRTLHPQLRELWKTDPILRALFMETKENARPQFQLLADNYAKCGYRFLPFGW
jgi:hypothetical protein